VREREGCLSLKSSLSSSSSSLVSPTPLYKLMSPFPYPFLMGKIYSSYFLFICHVSTVLNHLPSPSHYKPVLTSALLKKCCRNILHVVVKMGGWSVGRLGVWYGGELGGDER